MCGRAHRPRRHAKRPCRRASTRRHPRKQAGRAVGVFVAQVALRHVGQGGDARVRMKAETGERLSAIVKEIEKNKWLEALAEITRAHQPGYHAVGSAAGLVRDP